MKIGPLNILSRMRANDGQPAGLLIAALHWKRSITWRWVFTHRAFNTLSPKGFRYRRTHRQNKAWSFQAGLNLPFLGQLSIEAQPNMFR